LDPVQLALAAQTAEQVYAGTKCGIMDHLTANARPNGARVLMTPLVGHNTIDFKPYGYRRSSFNTNVKHELASSAYTSDALNANRR